MKQQILQNSGKKISNLQFFSLFSKKISNFFGSYLDFLTFAIDLNVFFIVIDYSALLSVKIGVFFLTLFLIAKLSLFDGLVVFVESTAGAASSMS